MVDLNFSGKGVVPCLRNVCKYAPTQNQEMGFYCNIRRVMCCAIFFPTVCVPS